MRGESRAAVVVKCAAAAGGVTFKRIVSVISRGASSPLGRAWLIGFNGADQRSCGVHQYAYIGARNSGALLLPRSSRRRRQQTTWRNDTCHGEIIRNMA